MKLKCHIQTLSTVVTPVKVKAIQYHTRLIKSMTKGILNDQAKRRALCSFTQGAVQPKHAMQDSQFLGFFFFTM